MDVVLVYELLVDKMDVCGCGWSECSLSECDVKWWMYSVHIMMLVDLVLMTV